MKHDLSPHALYSCPFTPEEYRGIWILYKMINFVKNPIVCKESSNSGYMPDLTTCIPNY